MYIYIYVATYNFQPILYIIIIILYVMYNFKHLSKYFTR